MKGTDSLLSLGKPWTPTPNPTPRLALALALLQGAHLSRDVHRNGLFLGRKPRCSGHLTCQALIAYKQEEEQDNLAGPDTLMVAYEIPAESGQGIPARKRHLVWGR